MRASRRLAAALIAAVSAAAGVQARTGAEARSRTDDRRLLAASDPFAAAPAEIRVLLVFSTAGSSAQVPVELWRKGDRLALIRFLADKDRGKYVVRRDGAFFFLAPGARRPVRLAPALAPAGGAALDALLGVRPSRDYAVDAVSEEAGLVTYDLVALPGVQSAVRLRWVVDRARRLPVRAEFRSAENRVERLIEFKSWRDPSRLEPAVLVAKEIARGGLPLTVEFLDLEPTAVAGQLFDLEDGSARAELPEPDLTDRR